MSCTINASVIEDGQKVWCCMEHCKAHIDNENAKHTQKLSKSYTASEDGIIVNDAWIKSLRGRKY